jgi:serine/threonine-protein kinase RsbW
MPRAEERTYTSDIGELRRMSSWWREWAVSNGLSADALDRGELCLNEAAGNVIQHGARPCAISIAFEADTDVVRMTVADNGEAFDPAAHPMADLAASLDEARPGGLGLRILRMCAATMVYRRIDGWNTLTLTLSRSTSADQSPPLRASG